MNGLYKFRLDVDRDGKRFAYNFVVNRWAFKFLDPIDLCADSFTAAIAGGVTKHVHDRLLVDRENLARDISDRAAHYILEIMAKDDLENGCPKNPHP